MKEGGSELRGGRRKGSAGIEEREEGGKAVKRGEGGEEEITDESGVGVTRGDGGRKTARGLREGVTRVKGGKGQQGAGGEGEKGVSRYLAREA